MLSQPLATLIFTVVAGVFSLVLSRKTDIPSVIFLLIFGILLGPDFADLVRPAVFRQNFPQYISLMVALILFEGGASLKLGQLKQVQAVVRNLLTVGVLATLLLASLAAYYVARLPWQQAVLFGAIMVVTGPTVVLPILHRIRIRENLHNILKWEAILVDPLGVIVAVVLFEFLMTGHRGIASGVFLFFGRIFLGAVMGLAGGWLMFHSLTKKWLLRFEGEELGGLSLLGMNLLVFGAAEWLVPESGLVASTVAGIYIGQKKFSLREHVFHFKKQVTLFALSVLFVLIAASVPLDAVKLVWREGLAVLAVLVFVVRPLSVSLSTWGIHKISWREKAFLASLAPRGIVSATLASLFAIAFEETPLIGKGHFLPLAFFVVAGSILFYAAASGLVARLLGLREEEGKGIIFVGANPLAFILAGLLKERNIPVYFVDTNPYTAKVAGEKGFPAFVGSGFDVDFIESLDLKSVSKIVALTANHEVNVLCCQAFSRFLGKRNVFRIWDKTDRWENVTSHEYDEAKGHPIYETGREGASDIHGLIRGGNYEIASRELKETLKVDPAGLKAVSVSFPLLAAAGDKIIFPYPDASLPQGSRLYYLKEKAIPQAV